MKRSVVKCLFIFALGIFILIPGTVNASVDPDWKYDLDLSDSVSSSIVRVEDGIVVMTYEGSASENNTIQKISNDGKLVKSIKNDYGYSISSVDGGVLVYGSHLITKLDKDLKVVWTATGQSNTKVVDLNDGFAMVIGGQFTIYDDYGNVVLSKNIDYNGLFSGNSYVKTIDFNTSLDGNNIIVSFLLVTCNGSCNANGVGVVVFSKNLEVVDKYQAELKFADDYLLSDTVETDDGFVFSGLKTVFMSKNNKIEKKLSTCSVDPYYLGKNVYLYAIDADGVNTYNASLSKYASNLELINSVTLVPSFESKTFGQMNSTGYSHLKEKTVFYDTDDGVKGVVLDNPIISDNASGEYSLIQYSMYEPTNAPADTPSDSGIIENIVKNPQTNSTVVLLVVIIVIVIVSSICYFLYKRKSISEN